MLDGSQDGLLGKALDSYRDPEHGVRSAGSRTSSLHLSLTEWKCVSEDNTLDCSCD